MLRRTNGEIRSFEFTQTPYQVFSSPFVSSTQPVTSKDSIFCLRSPFLVGGSYLVGLEHHQRTKGKFRMLEGEAMSSFPRTVAMQGLSIDMETKTRRSVRPVAWWKPCCYQARGRSSNHQFVASLNDTICMRYTKLPSVTSHHKFLTGAHQFSGVIGIQSFNLSRSHKLLYTMHYVCCRLRGNGEGMKQP